MSYYRVLLQRMLCAVGGLFLVVASGCGSGGDPRDFVMTVDPSNSAVEADYTTSGFNVSISPMWGFTANVAVTATAPSGFTCNPSCTMNLTSNGTLHFDTDSSLQAGTYTIAFSGVSGSHIHSAMATIVVSAWDGNPPPPDFDISVDPTHQTIVLSRGFKGAVPPFTITLVRYNHYTGPIVVSAAFPSAFSCPYPNCSLTVNGDSVQFYLSASPEPSYYFITFTGTVLPFVTKSAQASVSFYTPPPPPGPPPPGGTG